MALQKCIICQVATIGSILKFKSQWLMSGQTSCIASILNISFKIYYENGKSWENVLILVLCQEISVTSAAAEILAMVFSRSKVGHGGTWMSVHSNVAPLWSCALKFCPPGNTVKTIPKNTIFPTLFFSWYQFILIRMGLISILKPFKNL